MLLRPETPADHATIDKVVTSAFGRDPEARLVRLLRDDPKAYVPDLALVATVNDEVVGHILLTNATLHGQEDCPVLALGPLAVAPAHQRTGIGIALTEAALERADARRAQLVILLGHPTYYPRFGFEPASAHGIEAPSSQMPDAAFMVKRLTSYDRRITGKFGYPPAFDIT